MKILSAAQIREWDQYTIVHEPIASTDLMERAAQKCTDWLTQIEIDHRPIKIFCGKGNNGGDGLAIARQLAEQGIFSRIYILESGSAGTNDFQENLNRLHYYTTEIHFIKDETSFPVIKKDDVVIDALYGSGLNRQLEDLSKSIVEHINKSSALIVSIDLPSGMFADQSSLGNTIIKATHTLSFQVPKLAFLLPENEEFVGNLLVFDIGLHKQFLLENETQFEFVDETIIKSLYKPRKKFAHKGSFGHALLVAGSKGKIGAAQLCAKACLRTGAGLLTCTIPAIGLEIMQTSVAEAMCITVEDGDSINYQTYTTIGIGPGLGTDETALVRVNSLLTNYERPIVFDADALNIISQNPVLKQQLPAGSIVTPHPKEYERLFGTTQNNFDRLQNALANARALNCYIIIKGHYTFIACPNGKGFFNSTGNPGMATAGSGDVLTGILTGLLSQGYSSEAAVVLGVYLHGLAGDLAATELSQEAMITGDIINYLAPAYKTIMEF